MSNRATDPEALQVESIVDSVPRLPEIQDVTLSFDTDWSGDPAIYLSFLIRSNVEVNRDFVQKFLDYAEVIQAKILHSGIERFPYTDLKQAA